MGDWFSEKKWPTTVTFIVFISWIVVLGIYWNTTLSMIKIWYRSETFAHCFFVLPISAYLIWERRHALAAHRPSPSLWCVFLLLGLGFGWLLANLTNVLVVQQFTIVAMLPITVWMILGRMCVTAIFFPLMFLFFAVPVGEFLVPPLRDFTAIFTVKSLQWSGIPVFWEGRSLTVPGRTWIVAEACSGVRYIISMFTLGCLFASVIYKSWLRRILFVSASLLLPIVGNGIRAYGIVLLGYLSNNALASGVDHFLYGWLFFLILLFLLWWIGYQWREVDPSHLFTDAHEVFPQVTATICEVPTCSGGFS